MGYQTDSEGMNNQMTVVKYNKKNKGTVNREWFLNNVIHMHENTHMTLLDRITL